MIQQLGNFPNTIRNLDDKPNLSADAMKQALQQDVSVLWQKVIDIITYLNSPIPVTNGGTGGTTKQTGREGIGIYLGNESPSSVAASLQAGDIYLYVPDLV